MDESPETETKPYVLDEAIKNQSDPLNKKLDEPQSINNAQCNNSNNNCNINNQPQIVSNSHRNSFEIQRISDSHQTVDNVSTLMNDSNLLNNYHLEQKNLLTVDDGTDGAPSPKSVSGDEGSNEGTSVVPTKLPPGKVNTLEFFVDSEIWHVAYYLIDISWYQLNILLF